MTLDDLMDTDLTVIACLRVSQKGAIIVAGSTQESCVLCQTQVWVAPSSRRVGADHFACVECLLPGLELPKVQ